jgi:hypothetical protein
MTCEDKNPNGFYCNNEIRIKQGCDKKTYPKLVLNIFNEFLNFYLYPLGT